MSTQGRTSTNNLSKKENLKGISMNYKKNHSLTTYFIILVVLCGAVIGGAKALGQQKRNVYLSILVHCLLNSLGTIGLLVMVGAAGK